MSEPQKKPIWPWIAALLIGLPVLYVLSFGLACWLLSSEFVSYVQVQSAYRPLIRIAFHGPEIVAQPLRSYVRLWDGEDALLEGYILDKLDGLR